MKKIICVITIIILMGSIFLYTQTFDIIEEPKNVLIGVWKECFVEVYQRNYLEELIKVNEEKTYSDIEIEKYVTGVEFGYDKCVTQNDILQIGQLQNLKRLQIGISDKEEIDLSPLGNLTKLESLEITIQGGTANLEFISNLGQLKELDITLNDETIDLSPLGSLSYLRKLSIMPINGVAPDISFMKNLGQLREVSIWKCCELKDLSVFQNMLYLQELTVSYVEDVDLKHLSGLENLKVLDIIGGNIRNADGLTKLINLERLYLYDNRQDIEKISFDLSPITNMTELQAISILFINVEDINPLSKLKKLRYILLADTGVENIVPLKDLEKLKELYIFGNKSEKVKEQAVKYFNDTQDIMVTEDIPYGLL